MAKRVKAVLPVGEQVEITAPGKLPGDEVTKASTALPPSELPAAQATVSQLMNRLEGPYLISSAYIQTLLADDPVLREARIWADRIYGVSADPDAKARALAITCWYKKNFDSNGQVAQIINGIKGRVPAVGDYLDAVKKSLDELNPPSKFNLERFGPRERNLDQAVKSAVLQAICEEITIPNGLVTDTKNALGLIDYSKSQIKTSPEGRTVPIFYVSTVSGQFKFKEELIAKSSYIVVPENYLDKLNTTAADHVALSNQYESNSLARSRFDFQGNPDTIREWLGLHHARIIKTTNNKNQVEAKEAIYNQALGEDILEALAISDSLAFTEACLGRRISEEQGADLIEVAKHTVKEGSFLRNNLGDPTYARGLYTARAALITLSNGSDSKLWYFGSSVLDSTVDQLPGNLDSMVQSQGIALSQILGRISGMFKPKREPHKILASEVIARLLGPELFHTLNAGEAGPIPRDKWRVWADKSLRGSTPAEDILKISKIDPRLAEIVPPKLSQHFVLDFDSVRPGWKEVRTDWKAVA